MADPNAMDVDSSTIPPSSGMAVSETSVFVTQNIPSSASHASDSFDTVASSSRALTHQPVPSQAAPHSNGQPSGRQSNPNLAYFYPGSGEGDKADDAEEPPRIVRTGYVYNPLMMLHCLDGYVPTLDDVVGTGEGHPEEPMRIKRIFDRLKDQGLIRRMKEIETKEVTIDQVERVHGPEHWFRVQGTELFDDQHIQETKEHYDSLSLYVCRETARCARLSCGGVIQACQAVCTGEVRNAFAIVRPPGHHAEPDVHMGFCFYNNVAVAAREMQAKGLAKKVLILDWDVHHGNGTQRAFWEDETVLYMSIHRHDGGDFYPSSDYGGLDMVGEGPGEGKSVNVPWPSAGFGDGDYLYAFQRIIMPIAYEFNPDLVIISAGFDAAEGDHLGKCKVTPAGYGHMTHMLSALAGGKVVVALEGGYHLQAISDSSLAVAQVLLGETPAELGPMQASEVATELVYDVAKVQSKYWKSIDTKACEPPEVGSAETEYVHTVSDLLKAYRTKHLYDNFGLFPFPIAPTDLDKAYHDQVLVSEGVYDGEENGTTVIFVHDFGNLRVETESRATTDINAESSYLIDTSDAVIRWVQERNYNLIDINVMRHLRTTFANGPKSLTKSGEHRQLMLYIWDNVIELSSAGNVVLIGHGSGCGAVMELVNRREVQGKVKAVVQVAGLHSLVRVDPDNEARRAWFSKNNRAYVPKEHPLITEAPSNVHKRLGGQIHTSAKAKVVDVLVDVLPQIKEFVDSKVPSATPPANGHVP